MVTFQAHNLFESMGSNPIPATTSIFTNIWDIIKNWIIYIGVSPNGKAPPFAQLI